MAVAGDGLVTPLPASVRIDAHRREREFHDALASPLRAAEMPPRAPDRLEQQLLRLSGNLEGVRTLELGCGTGDLTLQLAAQGALLTALDLSPGMVAIARQRVERFEPSAEVRFIVAPVEQSGLMAQSFDLVIGKWILHHADVRGAATEIRRVLRPRGRALFAENSALNPLLALSRRHLAGRWGIPLYGTRDEHPLTAADFAVFCQGFPLMRLRFPDCCFFQLFDRQILKFRHRRLSRIFRGADRVTGAIPLFRRLSYHVILELSS
jgi:SAM-dependent methyltransferase